MDGCSDAGNIAGREPGIEALRSVASTATGGKANGSLLASGLDDGAAARDEAEANGCDGGGGGFLLPPVDRTTGGWRSGTADTATGADQ